MLPINLDPSCMRAFLAVAEAGSFTAAGQRLGRSQSAVSLQVKRIESQLGVTLLARGPRNVGLTPAGEQLIERVRRLIALNDELAEGARAPEVAGAVRVGVPEDFASTHLPALLREFTQRHPRISLEVTCELTLPLLDRFAAGDLDLVLFKRRPGGPDGEVLLREQMVWVTGELGETPAASAPLPLVCAPRPCVLRNLATRALEAAGRPWRIAFSSGSLAGNHAALHAGLGIAALPLEMVPAGLRVLPAGELPELHDIETAMLGANSLSPAACVLRDAMRQARAQGRFVAGK